MAKVIAMTVIQLTEKPGQGGDKNKGLSPTKPKVREIMPGTVLELENPLLQELLDAKAVRKPEPGEKVQVDVDSVPSQQADAQKTAEEEQKAAALKEAEEIGVPGVRENMKLDTIKKKIEEFRAEQGQGGAEGAPQAAGGEDGEGLV